MRQSVSLPASVASQVRSLAKARRLSASRLLLELIENGIEAEKRKQQEFFDLAERFRNATDPDEVKRLGDQMGRIVFAKNRHVGQSALRSSPAFDRANARSGDQYR